jgi:hypothetical protein
MAGFNPWQSPPLVKMPTRFIIYHPFKIIS